MDSSEEEGQSSQPKPLNATSPCYVCHGYHPTSPAVDRLLYKLSSSGARIPIRFLLVLCRNQPCASPGLLPPTYLLGHVRFCSKVTDMAHSSILRRMKPDWAATSWIRSMIFSHTRGTPMWDVGSTSRSVFTRVPCSRPERSRGGARPGDTASPYEC